MLISIEDCIFKPQIAILLCHARNSSKLLIEVPKNKRLSYHIAHNNNYFLIPAGNFIVRNVDSRGVSTIYMKTYTMKLSRT